MAAKQASFFASDLTVIGTVHSPGTLEIEGAVKGDVAVADLVVGPQGRLNARVGAGRMASAGTVAGTIKARAVSFLSGGVFRGEVEYEALTIDPDSDVEARMHPVEPGSPRMAVLPSVPEAMFEVGGGRARAETLGAATASARPEVRLPPPPPRTPPQTLTLPPPLSAKRPPPRRAALWIGAFLSAMLLGAGAAALLSDPIGRQWVEDASEDGEAWLATLFEPAETTMPGTASGGAVPAPQPDRAESASQAPEPAAATQLAEPDPAVPAAVPAPSPAPVAETATPAPVEALPTPAAPVPPEPMADSAPAVPLPERPPAALRVLGGDNGAEPVDLTPVPPALMDAVAPTAPAETDRPVNTDIGDPAPEPVMTTEGPEPVAAPAEAAPAPVPPAPSTVVEDTAPVTPPNEKPAAETPAEAPAPADAVPPVEAQGVIETPLEPAPLVSDMEPMRTEPETMEPVPAVPEDAPPAPAPEAPAEPPVAPVAPVDGRAEAPAPAAEPPLPPRPQAKPETVPPALARPAPPVTDPAPAPRTAQPAAPSRPAAIPADTDADGDGCVWVVQCSDDAPNGGKCVSVRQCRP
jgi:Meckel syndrome type 1 protein